MSDKITKEQALEALELLRQFAEQDGGETEGGDVVEIPSPEAILEMDLEALTATATALSIDVEGKKEKMIRKLLTTLSNVSTETEVNETDLDNLAEALGLTPDDKFSKTLAAVKEWVENLSVSGEASTEETPAEGEAEAEETPAEGEAEAEVEADPAAETEVEAEAEAAPEGADGVDRKKIASKVKKLPDVKTMTAQLTAYNAAATEEIPFNAKKEATVKTAYAALLAELVTFSEEVAAWGVAYIRDSAGWCCGLPLEDVKVKNEARECGRCQITKAVFAFDGETSEFTKLALKAK